MELKQLRVLQAIAETGSFVEAAERLGLTQSALSHQVHNLEEELEETLLIRARPKVYPSPAGQAVLDASRRIFAEMDALEARFLKAKKGPVAGVLRVAASNMAIVYVLGDLCETFIAKHPEIELVIRATETTEEAVRRVLIGTADIAFTPFGMWRDTPRLTRLMLGSTEHAFIVARGHPLALHESVAVEELRGYPFVQFQPGSGTRKLTDEIFVANGGYPRVITESNDAQFIKRMVALGLASALLPVYALTDDALSDRLVLLRYSGGPLVVDFGLVHKDSVRMNAIELFKSVCLDARGGRRPRFTVAGVLRKAS